MAMKVRYQTIDGVILSEIRGGVRKQYVPDSLGSTIAMTDSTGAITDTFEYWPYGEVRTRTGTSTTPFLFCGTLGYYTDASGRAYVRARYLKMDTTRWLTEDSIGFDGGLDLYGYCSSSPQNYVDPSGTQVWDCSVWKNPTPHDFISTTQCGAWGYRVKSGVGAWGSGLVSSDDPYLDGGKPGKGKWGVRCDKVPMDTTTERELCKCIDRSRKDPPYYCLGVYCCTDWVQTMFDCACRGAGHSYWDPEVGRCSNGKY